MTSIANNLQSLIDLRSSYDTCYHAKESEASELIQHIGDRWNVYYISIKSAIACTLVVAIGLIASSVIPGTFLTGAAILGVISTIAALYTRVMIYMDTKHKDELFQMELPCLEFANFAADAVVTFDEIATMVEGDELNSETKAKLTLLYNRTIEVLYNLEPHCDQAQMAGVQKGAVDLAVKEIKACSEKVMLEDPWIERKGLPSSLMLLKETKSKFPEIEVIKVDPDGSYKQTAQTAIAATMLILDIYRSKLKPLS